MMTLKSGRHAIIVMTALICVGRPAVRAADSPPNEALKKFDLKIVGSLAVIEAEAEIKNKLAEARRLSRDLGYSLMQQKGTANPEEQKRNIKSLNDQITQIRSEISNVGQQMAMLPRGRGRFSYNGFASYYAAEQFAELNVYRTQLQAELLQDTAFLDQLKSEPADPKAKERIDAEVRDKRESYHQALLDVRKIVDAATEKYEELEKNSDVKKTLTALGKRMREKPKLGPSHEFQTNVKLLEKLEKAASNGEEETPSAKSARRSRHGTKIKRSTKAAATTQE
jgi:hypothetical protein